VGAVGAPGESAGPHLHDDAGDALVGFAKVRERATALEGEGGLGHDGQVLEVLEVLEVLQGEARCLGETEGSTWRFPLGTLSTWSTSSTSSVRSLRMAVATRTGFVT
jgi:hypothetical protein